MSAMNATPARHCAITGGADGIGRALAERYAADGFAITIIDRDAARAESLCASLRAGGSVATALIADLASTAGTLVATRALASLPPIDVFVHSAGISAVGRFGALDLAAQTRVLDINLRAPLQLSAWLLRDGHLATGATLVFIASLSVFSGYPGASVYAASKDGIAAYARTLRVALRGGGINVLTVFPGPTRTAHARRYSPDNRRERRRMPPEHLAALIAAAVDRRDATLVPGAANRALAALVRLAPGLSEWLMRKTIFDKLPEN